MNLPLKPSDLSPIDGFDSHDDESSTSGAEYAKFDAALPEKLWHGRGGAAVYPGAVNCQIELLRWKDKKVIDRIVQKPGEKLPDIDALNNEIDPKEWEEDPFTGAPKGPWIKNLTNFFVDPKTGTKIIVSNSTAGQKAAFTELKERTSFMRNFRGENVFAVITLSSKLMPTRYGPKQRPHFEIIEWRAFGGSSAPALPPAPIAPLTAGEITGDEIPDHPAPKTKKTKVAAGAAKPFDDAIGF